MNTSNEREQLAARIHEQELEHKGALGGLANATNDLQSAVESGAPDSDLERLQSERDAARRRLERAELRLRNLRESEAPALERAIAERDSEATRQELVSLGEAAAAAYARVAELISEIEATLEPLDKRRVASAFQLREQMRNAAKQHSFELSPPTMPVPPKELTARLHAVLAEAVARLDYASRCLGS